VPWPKISPASCMRSAAFSMMSPKVFMIREIA
jgi:hypothetical protein